MTTLFDLRNLGISPGHARHDALRLELVPYRQAGEDYTAPGDGVVDAELDTVAMIDGTSFRLRFATRYTGPCARCLEPAHVDVDVDGRAVHDPDETDEQLRSEWVDDRANTLDVTGWAQEEVGLQFPSRVLCRPDCRGLCPQCGVDLNQVEGEHVHEAPTDSRWDALRRLQLNADDETAGDDA